MLAIEIINCENGYIILEGNSLATNQPYNYDRRKWVCQTPDQLAILVKGLAENSDVKPMGRP